MYKHSTKDGHSFPEFTKAMKRRVTQEGGGLELFKDISFLHTASLLLHILVWKSTSVERCPMKWEEKLYNCAFLSGNNFSYNSLIFTTANI